MKSCSLLLAVTLGFALVGCGDTATPPAPAKQPLVVQAPLEVEDLARVLNVQMYRFHVDLEPGWYEINAWMESWTKGVTVPETARWGRMISNIRSGQLLLQMPTKEFPQMVFSFGGMSLGMEQPLEQFWLKELKGGGLGCSRQDQFPVVLDQDLTFFTATTNAGSFLTNPHDYSDNDRAWVVKARFSRSSESALGAKNNAK